MRVQCIVYHIFQYFNIILQKSTLFSHTARHTFPILCGLGFKVTERIVPSVVVAVAVTIIAGCTVVPSRLWVRNTENICAIKARLAYYCVRLSTTPRHASWIQRHRFLHHRSQAGTRATNCCCWSSYFPELGCFAACRLAGNDDDHGRQDSSQPVAANQPKATRFGPTWLFVILREIKTSINPCFA